MSRPGNRNAAKPAGARRVRLAGQMILPEAMVVLTPARVRAYGSIGRTLDAALLALPSVERSFGLRPPTAPG